MSSTIKPFDDLKQFLTYFASVWGVLSAFTLSFPLLNNLWKIIRLPTVPWVGIETWSALSTLTGIFVVYIIFTNSRRNLPTAFRFSAIQYFVVAMITTIFYLVIIPAWPNIGLGSSTQTGMVSLFSLDFIVRVLQALLAPIEPVTYLAITSFFTASFAKPAVQEWHDRNV